MKVLEISTTNQMYIALGVLAFIILFLIILFSNRAKHKARANTLEEVMKQKEKPVTHSESKKTVVHVVEHKEPKEHAEHKKHTEHVEHKKTVVHVEHKHKEDDED